MEKCRGVKSVTLSLPCLKERSFDATVQQAVYIIVDLRYEHEDSVHGLEVGEVGVGDAVLPPVEEVDHGARARVYRLRHAEHRHEAEDPLAAAVRPPFEDRLETHHSQLRKVFATI